MVPIVERLVPSDSRERYWSCAEESLLALIWLKRKPFDINSGSKGRLIAQEVKLACRWLETRTVQALLYPLTPGSGAASK